MKKVYVTPRSITKDGHHSLKKLESAGLELILGPSGKQPTEEEQLKTLPECVAYLAGVESISSKVLESAKNLKIISRNGVGIDGIDLEVAKSLGIEVKIAAGSNSQGVAELAIGLLFSAVRYIPISNDNMKKGNWKREMGIELEEKTLGVIGTGNIGKRVIKMAVGLNMKVLGYDLYPDGDFRPSDNFRYATLNEIFINSDFITLHCPPGKEPLINKEAITTMKDGVYIINTARAGVVNEDDVLNALNDGKINVYVTDVYNKEPPGITNLIIHEHTIATPHLGGYTIESVDRAAEEAVDNIIEFLNLDKVHIESSKVNSLEDFVSSSLTRENEVNIAWLGQAGFAIKFKDKLIILDPYLSDYLSKKYKGKLFPHVRLMDIPILPENVKKPDYVLSSHAHSDHMDPETMTILSKKNPNCKFIVPEAEIEEAVNRGINRKQIIPANANEVMELGEDIKVTGIAAAHEDLEINEKGQHRFLGYVLHLGDIDIYHSGDCTPYEGLLKTIKSFNIHLALLPVNGRDEYRLKNGIRGNFKIPEVLQLCRDAKIKQLLVHHFGMFAYNTVTNEELEKLRYENSDNLQIIIPEINNIYKITRHKT